MSRNKGKRKMKRANNTGEVIDDINRKEGKAENGQSAEEAAMEDSANVDNLPDKTSGDQDILDAKEKVEIDPSEQLARDLAEMKDKYLRLYSEFENFRRRNAKERLELISNANQELIVDLLPVLDDFERAEEALGQDDQNKNMRQGFELIHKRMKSILQGSGLKEMENQKGADFNTEYHEAIAQVPVEDEKLKGKVYDIVEKGYFLNDKVIRFARVVTGS